MPSFPSLYKKKLSAYTMIEILIVVAIIGLLVLALTLSMRKQRLKAEDAKMKADIQRLKIAFEDYYNDNNCYPPATWFDGPEDCDSTNLQPYLEYIPCHRKTHLPYDLEKDATGCSWFKLYTTLGDEADPEIAALCSPLGSNLGNYCISSTNSVCSVYCPAASGEPVAPSGGLGGSYYCRNIGSCRWYDNTVWNCTPNYEDMYCTGSGSCSSTGACTLK